MPQCESVTRTGNRCKNTCQSKFCHRHIHTTDETCAVCLTHMNETNSRRLDCGHSFHTQCINRWKRTSYTCPMCRTPFDQPMYRVRLTIEPDEREMEMRTSNITSIIDMFGLDNHFDGFFTDIRFAVTNMEILNEILREIGFITTSSNLSSSNTVSTTEF
jgi:hypothetical protein